MVKLVKRFVIAIGKSIRDAIMHDGVEHAGYLSFLMMLTIFPFLVFFVAIVGNIGDEKLASILVNIILNSSWANFIDALKPRILEIVSTPPQSFLTIAIISALWTASSIFEGLRTILNRAYRIDSPPPYLKRRLVSFLEFFVSISIVTSLLTLFIIAPLLADLIKQIFGETSILAAIFDPSQENVRSIFLTLFVLFLISFSFYTLPNHKASFKSGLPGALLVIFCWLTFTYLFKFYITEMPQVNLIYGSIAGIIIALLYFYICSLLYIIGAEFNFHIKKS